MPVDFCGRCGTKRDLTSNDWLWGPICERCAAVVHAPDQRELEESELLRREFLAKKVARGRRPHPPAGYWKHVEDRVRFHSEYARAHPLDVETPWRSEYEFSCARLKCAIVFFEGGGYIAQFVIGGNEAAGRYLARLILGIMSRSIGQPITRWQSHADPWPVWTAFWYRETGGFWRPDLELSEVWRQLQAQREATTRELQVQREAKSN